MSVAVHSFRASFDGSPSQEASRMTSYNFGKDARSESTRRVCDLIRRLHPTKTAVCFEHKTKIAADTFRKWDAGLAAPSFVNTLTCARVYGPEFLHAALGDMAPDWLSADVREQQMQELRQQQAALAERLAELAERA